VAPGASELAAGVRSGVTDREQLLDELRPASFAIAYRMLGSVSEAEDVVQEALLRVHQALDAGEQIASPRAFVAKGLQRWGYFDPKRGTAYVHDEPAGGDGDLLDFAAVQAFLTGGTLYVVDPEDMPADGPVASVFRY
jgi:hypothetical protein